MSLNWASTGISTQIIGNYLIPILNNKSIGEISNRQDDSFNPNNKIFGIWTIIYGSILFSSLFNQNKNFSNDNLNSSIKNIFLYGTTSFNLLWVYLWTKNKTKLSSITLFGLTGTLIYILFNKNYWETIKDTFKNGAGLFSNGLSAYAIWTLTASFINLSLVLKKNNVFRVQTVNNMFIYSLVLVQIIWYLVLPNLQNKVKLLIPTGYSSKQWVSKNTLGIPVVGVLSALAYLKNKRYRKKIYLLLFVSLFSFLNQIKSSYF